MWICDQCGATIQTSRPTCWNCRWSRDGQPPRDPRRTRDLAAESNASRSPTQPLTTLACQRCGTALAHHGARLLLDLHQSPSVGGYQDQGRFHQGDQVDLYACPTCGHVELILRGRVYRPR